MEFLLDEAKNKWDVLPATDIYVDEPFSSASYSVTTRGIDANTVIIYAIGKWRGVQKNVNVTLTANWNQEPPIVQRSQWEE